MAFLTKCEKNGWNSCGLIHKYHKCIPSFHQKPAQLSKHLGIFQTEVIFPHFNFKPVLQMQSSRILYVNSDHEQYLQTLFPLIIQKQLSKKLMEIYHDNWHSWFQSWLHWYVWLIKMVSECCSGCACYNSWFQWLQWSVKSDAATYQCCAENPNQPTTRHIHRCSWIFIRRAKTVMPKLC